MRYDLPPHASRAPEPRPGAPLKPQPLILWSRTDLDWWPLHRPSERLYLAAEKAGWIVRMRYSGASIPAGWERARGPFRLEALGVAMAACRSGPFLLAMWERRNLIYSKRDGVLSSRESDEWKLTASRVRLAGVAWRDIPAAILTRVAKGTMSAPEAYEVHGAVPSYSDGDEGD